MKKTVIMVVYTHPTPQVVVYANWKAAAVALLTRKILITTDGKLVDTNENHVNHVGYACEMEVHG